MMRWWSGMVVFIPSTTNSSSARFRRMMQPSRVGAVDDQLADHAVVIGRHPVAGVEAAIDADVHAAGRDIILHQAGRGGEGLRILGIDAALDRMAVELDLAPA